MQELTSLEIRHWFLENKDFLLGRIDKIWQIKDAIIIRFYVKGVGNKELVVLPGGLFFTSHSIEKPCTPTNFAMLLRKYLKGKWVKKAYQYGLDRILVLEIENYLLIFEIMRMTNVILVEKNSMRIIGLLKPVKTKKRELFLHGVYSFPEQKKNILEVSLEEFVEDVKLGGIDGISKIYGISPEYINYANKKSTCIEEIYSLLRKMFNCKNACICDSKVYAYCICETGRYGDYINSLIENVFIGYFENISYYDNNSTHHKNAKLEYMRAGLDKLKHKMENLKRKADLLSMNISLIEDILKDPREGEYIKRINYKEKYIDVILDGEELRLFLFMNAFQNLSRYYDEIKRLRNKINNLKEIIKKEEMQESKNMKEVRRNIIIRKKEKRKWYEYFRWFLTSKGNLFVIGKDASTNEILIKKYLEKNDLVFHSLTPRSPFGILKNGKISEDKEEIMECGQFLASYSSLWKNKYFSGEVFYVYPEQVSKKTPSGEYMNKGSFMIYGKKNILKVTLELSFGYIRESKEVIYGPLILILKKTKDYAIIIPGDKKAKEIIPKIKARISRNLSIEDRNIVIGYDDEFFRERIPFGIGDVRGKI